MTLKTSLVITGDTSGATKAVDELSVSIGRLDATAKSASAPLDKVEKAEAGVAASAKPAATAVADLGKTVDKLDIAAKDAAPTLDKVGKAQADVASTAKPATSAVAELGGTVTKLDTAARDAAPALDKVEKAQAAVAATAGPAADGVAQLAAAQDHANTSARGMAQAAGSGATAAREAAAAQRAFADGRARTTASAQPATAANDAIAASAVTVGEQLSHVEAAQAGAATGATVHAAAAQELQGAIGTMLTQIAGGASVFDAMAAHGGTFAAALGAVAQASTGAKVQIDATGASGEAAGVDLSGMGDTVLDVADKASGMGGKLGSVAAFLGGPWGAAIGIAVNLLGGFVMGLIEGADESEKLAKSSVTLVDALAKEKVATDAAREAIKDYNEQQERARKTSEAAERQSLAQAEAALKVAEATRQKTRAELEHARAVAVASNGVPGGTVPGSAGILPGMKVAAIEAQLRDQTAAIADLQQTRRNLLISTGKASGEAAADPVKAINLRYDLERQAAEKAAASNDRLAKSYDRTVAAIERRRKADLDAEQERQRRENAKPKKASLGNQVEAGSAAAILSTAERYRGLSETNAGDRAQLKDLFRQANINVDPQMVAWCAAFVNSVLAANGVKGTGSLSARSFLGFGDATNAPNKGDIVVSKRGNDPTKGHVGFYQGTDAQGRVLVLGGNTGNRVGTQAIDRKDILGFRQAPSAADSYKDAQKAAADAAEQFRRDLEQVTALYLPATAEAKKYADELERIEKLAKSYDPAKAGSGLSPEQAAAARAALTTAHDKRMADINMTPEAKAADDAKKAIDGVIASLAAETAARQTLDPVQVAMARHQADLAKLTGEERTEREAALQGYYAQAEATRAVEEATRAAAQAQAELRDLALDAFDAIAIGGEKAGDVIKRLAQRIASAAIEAAVFGTGPLATLLKGAGTAAPVAASAGGSAAQATADLVGKSVGKSIGDKLDVVFGKGGGATALKNAGIGYTAASLTGGSGILGSAGGLIGGEVGKKLLSSVLGSFAGPLGSIAGGLLGGLVGGLFKSAKYGTANVS